MSPAADRNKVMPSARGDELERLLRCEGAVSELDHKICFTRLVRLLNLWPRGSERERAMLQAERQLERWPSHRRSSTLESLLAPGGSEVLDTARLVHTLVDLQPDDSARDPARIDHAIQSPLFGALAQLECRNCVVSLERLAAARATAKLAVLLLHQSLSRKPDWKQLQAWPALTTLQILAVTGETLVGDDPALWELLERCPVLHELDLSGSASPAVVSRLAEHPAVTGRLDRLVLYRCYLDDAAIDALGAVRFRALARLYLTGNPNVTEAAVERLRRAPSLSDCVIMTRH
jgi:hypothetical protein